MSQISYRAGDELDLDSVLDLYRESGLGERRPIDDRQVFSAMLSNANLVVTAWDDDLLVGIARTLTDFAYVGYLSDLPSGARTRSKVSESASYRKLGKKWDRDQCLSFSPRPQPANTTRGSASPAMKAPGS